MLWLRVPEKLYFKKGSMPVALNELKTVYNKKKAFIVTDTGLYRNGRIASIEKLLDDMNVQHTSFFAVSVPASPDNVKDGVKAAALFEPDVIIAVGGSNVINCAKLIRVLYEVPDADIAQLAADFCDIRKREALFPRTNVKASLVTVPTNSGTGEEVSPYASVDDGKNCCFLADYEIMPEFVVVDSDYMIAQTREEIALSAAAALVHLVSAYNSEYASEYTDGFVIKAMENIIRYLPSYLENGSADPIGCEKLAEASAMSGLAYANTNSTKYGPESAAEIAGMVRKMTDEDSDAFVRYRDLAMSLRIKGSNDKETITLLIEKIKTLTVLCGLE